MKQKYQAIPGPIFLGGPNNLHYFFVVKPFVKPWLKPDPKICSLGSPGGFSPLRPPESQGALSSGKANLHHEPLDARIFPEKFGFKWNGIHILHTREENNIWQIPFWFPWMIYSTCISMCYLVVLWTFVEHETSQKLWTKTMSLDVFGVCHGLPVILELLRPPKSKIAISRQLAELRLQWTQRHLEIGTRAVPRTCVFFPIFRWQLVALCSTCQVFRLPVFISLAFL